MSWTRRIAPVVGLFLLAPFVGEFLLGNLPVTQLAPGLFLAPLYGGGAVLVREIARRTGRGWPTMVLLAAVYAMVEEGPVDQLLWNDGYSGINMLHGPSFVPALGTSVEMIQTVLALHTIWSICVPILIVETLTPDRRTTPWLGRAGLSVVGVAYLAGAVLVFSGTWFQERFVGTWQEHTWVSLVIGALAVAAFTVPEEQRRRVARRAPSPLVVGAAALGLTSAYWAPVNLVTDDWYEWVGVAVWVLAAATGLALVRRWSGAAGWDQRHRCALAAGATLTYAWVAFPLRPEGAVPPDVDLIGNVLFAAVAVALLVWSGTVAARHRGPGVVAAPAPLGRADPLETGGPPCPPR